MREWGQVFKSTPNRLKGYFHSKILKKIFNGEARCRGCRKTDLWVVQQFAHQLAAYLLAAFCLLYEKKN